MTFFVKTISRRGLGAPMKPTDRGARRLVAARRLLGDRVDAAVHVGVRRRVVLVHRVEHRLRALRGGGGVEVDEAVAVDLAVEEREVRAGSLRVERSTSRPSLSVRHAS